MKESFFISWSPDSKYIASTSTDGRAVHVWDPVTGSKVADYKEPSAHFFVSWSPNGKYISLEGDDNNIQVWDPATGSKITDYREHNNWISFLSWSPDGKYIASTEGAGHTVHVWVAPK